ncbi:MAG: hypothetical protein IAE89_09905 [Anaerolineae bacterium]|nr:hypothetical protein [Anaerolineae bacterium]
MPSHHWAKNFTATNDDLEYLSGILLEKETPLKIDILARELVEHRLQQEKDALSKRFANVRMYAPALSYTVGEKVMFPEMNHAMGTVDLVREGRNPKHGHFSVIRVAFDDDLPAREFAAEFSDHRLNEASDEDYSLPGANELTADEIMASSKGEIIRTLEQALRADPELVSVAGLWFPRSLMLDANNGGQLHLAEAVLDIAEGGPMTTDELLEQIGGLGNAPHALQVFSMNYSLSQDNRFDEVGPVDTILWFLRRLEPSEVLTAPQLLQYSPLDYDPALLSEETIQLISEIDDEWSDFGKEDDDLEEAQITINYPHRRSGTLPLNASLRAIFPTARRTPRVFVTLVDALDGEEFFGWVVRQERYVYGLGKLFRKHHLPVGAILTVSRSEEPGKILIEFNAHRPRTEYVPLIAPKDGRLLFEYDRRSIGAEYDDLMVLGTDDLAAIDTFYQETQKSRRSLSHIMHNLVTELSRTSPQGTVHAKTLYSATNVLRRLPPEPIYAALVANSDFEHVGNNYWRLSGR